ncbi:hypothetical protein HK105_205731 [Polyrhizophydium stewartii]|uniref:mRNA m(6)A methyltransferase n=1 Tax=Polyrhizophydium stewartii TaxID=2732419 RepID=A0ABR4N5L7_9FUNG
MDESAEIDRQLRVLLARESELERRISVLLDEIAGLESGAGAGAGAGAGTSSVGAPPTSPTSTSSTLTAAVAASVSGSAGPGTPSALRLAARATPPVDAAGSPAVESDDAGGDDADLEEFEAPEWCVPIKANVLDFEWDALAEACQFDIICMDPPWQLASHAPTRGVAIAYQQLPDLLIESLPIEKLQTNGFIFIWVINNKYAKAFDLMAKWGYEYVDDITWVKQTVNRRMAKGHGYYLQHAKETCLVGRKGVDPPGCQHGVMSDVIFSARRGQSQKPEEIYEMMEALVPNGKYLEIFGRKNNLRDYWITIGNEL